MCVDTECFKGGEEDEESGPSVIERERKMDEDCNELAQETSRKHKRTLISETLTSVISLDDVIDVRYRAADEQRKDKRNDIVTARPYVDIDGVEDGEQGETPSDAVDDDGFAGVGELVEEHAEEEQVDECPDAKGPG